MKQQLMLVAMLSVGTALTTMGRLKPVAASLTPPATYNYSYTWNAGASEQYLNVNGVDSIPLYIRTADATYFNYTSTFNVIDGISVTQRFNRSNTTWQVSGTSYKPDEARIGSDATVSAVNFKWYFEFNNQTSKDYVLYLDLSSTASSDRVLVYDTNGIIYNTGFGDNDYYLGGPRIYNFYIPSYSNVKVYAPNISSLYYFDAWYLRDLGISDAYQQGLDAETDGILTDYLGTDAQQIGWVLIGIAAILFAFKGGK
jgi:hypothetical protein